MRCEGYVRGVVGVAVETFQIYFVARYKVTCCAYSFVPHNSARWCHRGGGIGKLLSAVSTKYQLL